MKTLWDSLPVCGVLHTPLVLFWKILQDYILAVFIFCFTEMYFKTIAKPGMELPVTIVNGFQTLTIVTWISNSGFAVVQNMSLF